jgi:MFS transporter, DHA3 family, macrolide efflux protein
VTGLTQRIAALSPAQREMLLRELGRESAATPKPDLTLPQLVARPDESFQPFPLTEVQEVYWAGRSGLFDLGTPGVNVYLEYELSGAEPQIDLLEDALHRLCELHPVLRLVMLPDGRQQVRAEIPPIRIERADLRDLPPGEVDAAIAAVRERFHYHPGAAGQWPLFGFLAQLLDSGRIRLHAWFDAWLIDGMSRTHLMLDLQRILRDPDAPLRSLPCTWRDYALSCEAIRGSAAWRRARDWWLERVPSLPPPPELPLAVPLGPHVRARFVHRIAPLLAPEAWGRFQEKAARRSLTASPALIAAFVEVIRTWSRHPRFSFSLEGTHHPPVHPGLPEIVGNFNTIYIVAADDPHGTFGERARRVQDQITDLLDHRLFSGFQVLREVRRLRGGGTHSLMPVNFNNLVDLQEAAPAGTDANSDASSTRVTELDRGINLPQILIMPSVYRDDAGGLGCKLQAVEEVFPPGLIQDLWQAYTDLLVRLADDDALWDGAELRLTPAAHLASRPSHQHVLDVNLGPRPDWVAGELWTGGPGEPLVRTGELARFLPGGELETLGRDEPAVLQKTPELPLPESGPLEEELGQLAGHVLGTAPLSPGDDFFAQGGTSFTAVLLLTRVRELFGDEHDLIPFLDEPTPRHLARLVRSELRQPRSSAVQPASRQSRIEPERKERATGPVHGMRLYLLLWFSQFVSGLGTGLGSFALGVWVYRQNASATQYSMFAFAATCTALLVGPLAGVLADRWDRKRLILLGDSGAAVMTSFMALALYTGQMRLWHVYVIVIAMVGFNALQGPAFVASISQLVARRQLGRVSGMIQASGIATGLICPPLSGALIPVIGYHGVIAIDISTFLFAFFVLLFIRLPRPTATAARWQRRSMLGDFRFGWDYLRQRPGLLSLLWVFAATNFALSIVQVLLTPLILSFGSATNLGFVNAATAAGGLVGSLVLSVWGGPQNRMKGILLFLLLQAPVLLLGALQPNVMLIAVACFIFMGLSPLIGGLSQAIWQSKVAHDIQGRVFAMRGLIVTSTAPLAFLLAGPLTDRVFEPLMAPGGALAETVGRIIGVGPGRGVGLLFICLGLFNLLAVGLASLSPRLRQLETELPDAAA